MKYIENYNYWLESNTFDDETKRELKNIKNDKNEIKDRFYQDLTFGTAGLRGKLGAGTNRMNKYTVARATQGLANVIVSRGEDAKKKGVAIAYDVRHKSKEFSEIASRILAANGIKVYLFEDIRPTPLLSYAVRELGTISGIVITASHNPKDYNGFKVYWDEGSQILDDIAEEILKNIEEIAFEDIKNIEFEEALKKEIIEYISSDIDDEYVEKVKGLTLNDDNIDKNIKVVYTPLNGTGNELVRRVLKERGFTDVHVVPEQEKPDSNFTTVGYPNPEDIKAFKYSQALGEKIDADILLATDPDCDRVAVMVKHNNDYKALNGNEMGYLMVHYILSSKHMNNNLPKNGAIIKSIVTGHFSEVIAQSYGVETFNTLTGFKNICGKANEWAKTKEYQFLFGYEESIGYTYGTFVGDKDGVISSMILVEMAAYYKKIGKTLIDALGDLYTKYGYYFDDVTSVVLEGLEGKDRIERIMIEFRENPIKEIDHIKLVENTDYLNDKTGIPKSNVLKYKYDDGSWYAIRPSGTEPKIKTYIYSEDKNEDISLQKIKLIKEEIMRKMNTIK